MWTECCEFVIARIKCFILFEGSRTFYAKSPVCLLVLATSGSAGYHVQNSIRCSETCVSNSLFRNVRRLPELRNLQTGGSNVAIKRRESKRQSLFFNPYPTAFPYGNGMVLHFYQQQEGSTTKTVHKVINKGLKAYV